VHRDATIEIRRRQVLSSSSGIGNCRPLGRRPEAHTDWVSDGTRGDYFARAASLEAASVGAFERLARELRAHDAPAALVRRAQHAAGDERRHALAMASLARQHGGRLRTVPRAPTASRSLSAIALENAIEGCAGETYAALVATYQSRYAAEARVRATFDAIARDETRHASLAHAVARWTESRLGPAEAALCRDARDTALRAFADAARRRAPDDASTFAGEPDPHVAAAFCDALCERYRSDAEMLT
jgi:rubrerythrin